MDSKSNNLNKKTNFRKVMEFNRAFDMVPIEPSNYSSFLEDSNGNIKYNPLKNIRKNIFKDSPNIIKLRCDLIKEELEELNDAILQNDLIEQRDACADILYVVYGMADVLGISMDDLFNNKINIDYFINNNLSNELLNKTIIDENKYTKDYDYNYENINITNLNTSNFEKVKLIKNKILGFDILSISNNELIILINFNLKYNCTIDDINSDDTIITKFELVSDKLFNLLKWTYLMTYSIGADSDSDFSIVHESNMSKLCDNEDDAKATVEDYRIKYIAGVSPYDTPYYYYLENLDKWIVKNLSTGKALKNIKYKKVNFKNSRFVF